MENKNKLHREVGLQSNLKLVISLISSLFSSKADIDRAISVINRVAGASAKIGFMSRITGTGTILGNVMIIDLNVPLMAGYPRNARDEKAFNTAVARALVSEFGRLNVGYLSPYPVVTRTVKLKVETDLTTDALLAHLGGVSERAEIVW